jgi:uncharacterized protein (UPF0210 family)
MRIRSITCFLDPRTRSIYSTLDQLSKLAQTARDLYSKAGLEVQSLRLATTPFPLLYPTEEIDSAVRLAQAMESDAHQRGFDYVSLGPALTNQPDSYRLVIPILKATHNVFLSGALTTPRGDTAQHSEVDFKAVRACAEIIHQAAAVSPDGFGNLRFAALANVAPNGPFFPGAFHQGTRPAFALAIECADVAYSAIRKAKNLAEARQSIVTTLESQGTALTSTANHLAQQFDIDFRGIDFSLAPFPEQWCSLGAALEALGLPALGRSGSLAAAAFLADTLDRGSWMRTGFNGLMMPVLEDSTLAARTAGGTFGVHDLLMYSAVCGTGLDTVPLPGDSTPEQIGALLTDVAALALRLNKPLTARLMPIPGKQAGDATEFKFAFFANGHVLPLPAAPLGGLFANSDKMEIRSRR